MIKGWRINPEWVRLHEERNSKKVQRWIDKRLESARISAQLARLDYALGKNPNPVITFTEAA